MNTNNEQTRVFVSSQCTPCRIVKKLIKAGKVNIKDTILIDVGTQEGLSCAKKLGVHQVPSAYQGKESCEILLDEERQFVIIQCPSKE